VVDKTLEDVAHEIKEIEPPVFPSLDRVPVGKDREAIVITVTQGQVRPYTYKGQAYKRVGNTSPEMSRDEYNRMLLERLHGESRWENQPAESWRIRNLDVSEITRTITEAIRRGRMEDPGTRDPDALMRGMGLIRDGRLLRAASVLFGRSEHLEADFPQCLLRVARFKGTDKTEFVDNRQFHGNAFDLLVRAERFLRENLPVAGRVLPDLFERVDDPLYPPVALREALANALCHRDYSIGGGSVAVAIYDDRLEITSSGTLHFGLTVDALFQPHESLPWNPLIARVLYRRGIIESWGRGTLKMAELTEQAGLPRPEIEETGGCVTVRFRPGRYVPPERTLTKRQQRILGLLSRHGRMPLREIKLSLAGDVPDWAVKEDLALLGSLRLIDHAGYGRGAYWFLKQK
jgi:ATP-dependent DNA helicase RecG